MHTVLARLRGCVPPLPSEAPAGPTTGYGPDSPARPLARAAYFPQAHSSAQPGSPTIDVASAWLVVCSQPRPRGHRSPAVQAADSDRRNQQIPWAAPTLGRPSRWRTNPEAALPSVAPPLHRFAQTAPALRDGRPSSGLDHHPSTALPWRVTGAPVAAEMGRAADGQSPSPAFPEVAATRDASCANRAAPRAISAWVCHSRARD